MFGTMMLRLLVLASIGLTAGFAVVAGLLSREWGWSEYASDALYVVYYQESQQPIPFYLVNADGSGQQWRLTPDDGNLVSVGCSPDGRTFAFVTDSSHLYVVNQAGILFDRNLDRHGVNRISVANNGTVAYLGEVIVNARESYPVNQLDEFGSVAISSDMALWNYGNGGISVFSSAGHRVFSIPYGYGSRWFAPETIFGFATPYGSPRQFRLIADAETQKTVLLHDGSLAFGIISPDATKRVVWDNNVTMNRMVLSDAFSNDHAREIISATGNYQSICFLTFRPEMLIDQSQ